jgi:GrpB-like predicted nucleotidyltransferase (UPF0157 family)
MVERLIPADPGSLVVLRSYDPQWPEDYATHEARIRAALGGRALELHHAGSTSVPGLAAKPVIDVVLVVEDASDETSYAEGLVSAGYAFALREPDWHEHRLFKVLDGEPRVNLHVFGPDCPEVARMLAFRDRLRTSEADRLLYERTKRELAGQTWAIVQDYADAKSAVVADIMARSLIR